MTKGPILDALWKKLPKERQQKILEKSQAMETEYLTLQALRKMVGLTQANVSEHLDIPQPNVSRLEKSSDMLISTLREYVEAVGGKLNLTVEFQDQPPINLSGLGDLIDGNTRNELRE